MHTINISNNIWWKTAIKLLKYSNYIQNYTFLTSKLFIDLWFPHWIMLPQSIETIGSEVPLYCQGPSLYPLAEGSAPSVRNVSLPKELIPTVVFGQQL